MKLQTNHTKSCGCFKKKGSQYAHGMCKTKVYAVWACMKHRCSNPNAQGYKNYGGRGIRVCDRWQKFENFIEDMGFPPEGCSIDRIDNNGNYEPSNCRWATQKQQSSNHRKNVYIEYNGETMTASEFGRRHNLCIQTVLDRTHQGWSAQQILERYGKKV